MLQAWHTCIWEMSPILLWSPVRLDGESRCTAVLRFLQRCSIDRVQGRALAGPLKDIQRLVPKPLLCCLGCVLMVVVLLRSLVLWTGSLCTLLCSSLPRSGLVSQSLRNILTTWCYHHAFTVGMVSDFLQTWHLAFRQKSSILVSSDQRILFLMVGESLGAFRQNSKLAVRCLLLRSGFCLTTIIKTWFVECCRDGRTFQKDNSLSELPLASWSPPWPRPYSPNFSVCLGQPALERVLVVPNFFNWRMMRPLCC